jgi:hypothetical protein
MLEDLDRCDMEGNDGRECVFFVNDYHLTEDPQERQQLMAIKLGNYADAISKGQIGDPKIPRKHYRVELNCGYDPQGLYDCFDRLQVLDETERIIEIPVSVVINPKEKLSDVNKHFAELNRKNKKK